VRAWERPSRPRSCGTDSATLGALTVACSSRRPVAPGPGGSVGVVSGSASVLLRVLTVVVVAAVALVVLAWALQRRLIYLPGGGRVPSVGAVLPGGQEVSFDTADGLRLRGWFVPGSAGAAAATVLVFNGNAADRSARAPLAGALARAGTSVLLFDYRGYGGNPGHPSETGLAADARAARDYLLSRPDVRPGSIVYFGESLGAAVAIGLAVEHPPAALVLRSPFTSLADVGRRHYPYLPVRQLLKDRYDSIGRVGAVRCPLLVLAGGADGIVPARQSRQVYDAAAEPKRYVEIPDAGHNDWDLLAGDRLLREVLAAIRTSRRSLS
jgi:fermentation-respiration switch protein FrsA (DUF1100 family)